MVCWVDLKMKKATRVGTIIGTIAKIRVALMRYTRCQKFFSPPLTLTLSPHWGERG